MHTSSALHSYVLLDPFWFLRVEVAAVAAVAVVVAVEEVVEEAMDYVSFYGYTCQLYYSTASSK